MPVRLAMPPDRLARPVASRALSVALAALLTVTAVAVGEHTSAAQAATTEEDITGVWAIRQNRPFSPEVYDLDIAGVSSRVAWNQVEPEPDEYDWSVFDDVLAQAREHNKRVRLSVMFGSNTPDWVDVDWFTGSASSPCDSAGVSLPRPWDEDLLREQVDLIRASAARYRDTPEVAFFHVAGPSALWEELCLPDNTTNQPGYSNDAIFDAWTRVLDTWVDVRGDKRLSFSASAAPTFYPDLGIDIANYGLDAVGRDFSPQWNYLDTRWANAVHIVSDDWTPRAAIGWQFWGSTVWSRRTADFEGTLRLGQDAGATYIEIYNDDLEQARLGAIAEQVHAEMLQSSDRSTPPGEEPPPGDDDPSQPDTTPPSVTLEQPTRGDVIRNSSVTVSGSASDNRAVAEIRVAIRDLATRQWLQSNGSWTDSYTELNVAPGRQAATTSWADTVTIDRSSRFVVGVRAVDAAGHRSDPVWRWFEVDR